MTAASIPFSPLRPLDVRRAVRAVYPEAVEHIDGGTFDLPGGSTLSRCADGSWTLVGADGVLVQLRTPPQLGVALRRYMLVIPAPLLPLLEEIAVLQGAPLGVVDFDWKGRLRDAEQLGLIERAGATAWRLTQAGEEAAEAHRSSAFVAVCVRREGL